MHTIALVIDITPFDPSGERARPIERDAVVRAIEAACTKIGFFIIAGHGVPAALVDRMLATSRAFFDLPAGEKQRVARPRPEQSRGYLAVGAENLSYSRGDASTTDLKDFFAIGPIDVQEVHPQTGYSVWLPADARSRVDVSSQIRIRTTFTVTVNCIPWVVWEESS